MRHKRNANRRHHIPKMSFKVRNWPAYEAALRQRSSLTLWIEDAKLECWQTMGPGGQVRYPDQPAFGVRAGVAADRGPDDIGAVVDGPDDISAGSHHGQPSAVMLPVIQATSVPHGPLHVLIDSTGLPLDQIDDSIGRVTADGAYDGAYDGALTYQTIAQHGDGIGGGDPTALDIHPQRGTGSTDAARSPFGDDCRLAWQIATDYGQRSLVETTMGRYKSLIGPRLRARGFAGQQTEAVISVAVQPVIA